MQNVTTMKNYDHLPLLLFPIRIETKYYRELIKKDNANNIEYGLRVRIFPDQVSINEFEPRLTHTEYEDAKEFWIMRQTNGNLVMNNEPNDFQMMARTQTNSDIRNLCLELSDDSLSDDDRNEKNSSLFNLLVEEYWNSLQSTYTTQRASYMVKHVVRDVNIEQIETNMLYIPEFVNEEDLAIREEDDFKTATYSTFPSKFILYGKFLDGHGHIDGIFEPTQNTNKGLPVSFLRVVKHAFSNKRGEIIELLDKPPSDPLVELDPELRWLSNFDEAVAKGMALRLPLTKEQYDSGFEYLLVYGINDATPDVCKAQVEELFISHKYHTGFSFIKQNTPSNLTTDTEAELNSLLKGQKVKFNEIFATVSESSNGDRFEKMLGIDNVVEGSKNANIMDELNASRMGSLIYPTVLGYFVERFINIESEPRIGLDQLKYHFENYVVPPGIVFRVGKVPYGLLPVTISDIWQEPNPQSNLTSLVSLIIKLKTYWLKKSENTPTIQSIEVNPQENFINILSKEAHSHSYYVRGARLTTYVYNYLKYLQGLNNDTNFTQIHDKLKLIVDEKTGKIISLLDDDDLEGIWRNDDDLKSLTSAFEQIIFGSGLSDIEYSLVGPVSDLVEFSQNFDNYYQVTTDEQLIEIVDRSLLFRFLVNSANFYAVHLLEDNQRSKHLEEIQALLSRYMDTTEDEQTKMEKNFVKELETMFSKILDTTSYRLDTWLTSLASSRLDATRHVEQFTKGIKIGAYGWIHNLKPKVIQDKIQGGYIHSFSEAHTSAFTVLRDGYLNYFNQNKRDLMKINLNSSRTKKALQTIQAVQTIPVGEYLGMVFERSMHDENLDFLIDEFRKYFPLVKDDLPELEEEGSSYSERIIPRNMTDGRDLHDRWADIRIKFEQNSVNLTPETLFEAIMRRQVHPVWYDVFGASLFSVDANIDGNEEPEDKLKIVLLQLIPIFDKLLDIIDGVADLGMYEAIFQSVNMKFDRTAAVLEGLNADRPIPDIESASIPLTGPRITRRIILPFVEDEFDISTYSIIELNDSPVEWNPKVICEPNYNRFIAKFVGNMKIWVRPDESNIDETEWKVFTIEELDLSAIDLVYYSATELRNRIVTQILIDNRDWTSGDKIDFFEFSRADLNSEDLDSLSIRELQFILKPLKEMTGKADPLKFDHLFFQTDESDQEPIEFDIDNRNMEIFPLCVRLYSLLHLLKHLIQDLNNSLNNDDIDQKLNILKKSQHFHLQSSIPLDDSLNLITESVLLNNHISNVITEINSRVSIVIGEIFNNYPMWELSQPEGDASVHSSISDIISFLLDLISNLDGQGNRILDAAILKERIGDILQMVDPLDVIEFSRISDLIYEKIVESMRILTNIESLVVLPSFIPPDQMIGKLENQDDREDKNKVKSWLEKVAMVKPKFRYFDKLMDYSRVSTSLEYEYKIDDRFFRTTEQLLTDNDNPLTLLAITLSDVGNEFTFPPNIQDKRIYGLVLDEWTEKYVQDDQETTIALHHESPNSEPPHCLLLGILPNNATTWSSSTIRKIIEEAMDLMKIRTVDYRSLGELKSFIPLTMVNTTGDPVRSILYSQDT